MKKTKVIMSALLILSLMFSVVACSKKEKTSDTILWINTTYIVLTKSNDLDYKLVGGVKKTDGYEEDFQEMLEAWWGISDKRTTDEMITFLLEEGHKSRFKELVEEFDLGSEEGSNLLIEEYPEDEDYISFIHNTYKKSGDKAVLAWDLSRANSVIAQAYIAGYYTYEEAMDKSLEISKTIQKSFTSWEDMFDNYLDGFKFWTLLLDEDGEIISIESDQSVMERKSIIEKLKSQPKSPFSLDWNTKLEKTW